MEHTFLVCGYPRSRTLWLSKFLTVEGYSACTHEATEKAGSPQEFWSNACAHNVQVYGNSDSANLFVLPSLLAMRPMTKVLWIDRPVDEVGHSLKESGIPSSSNAMSVMIDLRYYYGDLFDVVFDYHTLIHPEVCEQIWEWCLPGVEFDYKRWRTFDETKICYSKSNPYPQKDFKKFLEWANKDLLEEKEFRAL